MFYQAFPKHSTHLLHAVRPDPASLGLYWRYHTHTLHTHMLIVSVLSDNYVHRLVQNKGDGKLVEVGGEGQVLPSDEKIDSLQLEVYYAIIKYNYYSCLYVVGVLVFLFAE